MPGGALIQIVPAASHPASALRRRCVSGEARSNAMRAIRAIRTLFLALLVSLVPASSFAGVFFPSPSLRPCCPCTRSRFVPGMAISGPPGIGPTAKPATTGYREPGCLLPSPVFSGLPATGALVAASILACRLLGPPRWLLRRRELRLRLWRRGLLWRPLGGRTLCL